MKTFLRGKTHPAHLEDPEKNTKNPKHCINKSVYLKEYVTIYYSKQRNQTLRFLHFSMSNLQVVILHTLVSMAFQEPNQIM